MGIYDNDRYIFIKEDKNGTKYYQERFCPKCGGSGYISYYHYIQGGECFECGGSGLGHSIVKDYTPEYAEKLAAAREKRRLKKIEELKATAADRNKEFLAKEGFTPEGKTYFVLGKTYEIKDELKAMGAKWDNLSKHWRLPQDTDKYPTLEIDVAEMYKPNEAGIYEWQNWKAEDNHVAAIKAAESTSVSKSSTSSFVGSVGERITFEAKLDTRVEFEGFRRVPWAAPSPQYLYRFIDSVGNVYTWKTETLIDGVQGDNFTITGTVKEHKVYKMENQTTLSRCKVVKLS